MQSEKNSPLEFGPRQNHASQRKKKKNVPRKPRLNPLFEYRKKDSRKQIVIFIYFPLCSHLLIFYQRLSTPLRSSDGPLLVQDPDALSGVDRLLLLLSSLLDSLIRLRDDDLDVARVRHVRVDTTVSTVGSSPLLGSLIDLDVGNNEVGAFETLDFGIGLGVLEKTEQELSRLDRPTGTGGTELLSLRGPSSSTSVPPHGNGLFMLLDVAEEGNSAAKLHARDGLGSFAGVLEGDTEERTTAHGRFGLVAGLDGVADHRVGYFRRWICWG